MPARQGAAIAVAAAAGAAAGFAVARAGGDWGTRRLLNGNYAWMDAKVGPLREPVCTT
jgi:hypothetical protein